VPAGSGAGVFFAVGDRRAIGPQAAAKIQLLSVGVVAFLVLFVCVVQFVLLSISGNER